MGALAKVSARWNEHWYTAVPPHRMALFRALLGLYLTIYFATLAPHVEVYFSDEGVYVPYLIPDWAPPPAIAWALFSVMVGAAVALTMGLWPRTSTWVVLTLFGHHYFLQLATKQSSFERLIFVYLLVLAFAESHHALAPGARNQPTPPPIAIWPERLLRFQTVLLYLGSGIWKAFNPAWHTGALLYATFQGMWATPFAFWLVRQGLGETAWTLLSWGVIAFEIALGFALMFRRTRVLAVLLGTAFHVANCVVLTIPEFLLCLTAYAVFLPEEFLRRWLTPRARAKPASPTPSAHAG